LLFGAGNVLLAQSSRVDSLKQSIASAVTDTSKINLYLQLHDELRLSDFNQAASIARISFDLASGINWPKGIALAGKNFGVALSLLGRYDSAIMIIEIAKQKSIEIGDLVNAGHCQMALGNIQYDQTNYDEALVYYFESLKTATSINNNKGISSALIWIGIIYQHAKTDFDAAISTYKEAVVYADKDGNDLNKGYIFGNLAIIYNEQDQYDSAIVYNKASLAIKVKFQDQRGIGNSYNNIGNDFYESGLLDSAIYYYRRSLEIREQLNDRTGIVSATINLARIYMDNDDFILAEKLLVDADSLAKVLNYREALQSTSFFLSEIYEKNGSLEKALMAYKAYKAVSDSIFNIASDKSISELQIAFDTEKKEQQIELQSAQIGKQRAQNQLNVVIIIGLILSLILLISLVLLLRGRARKKQVLAKQEMEIQLRKAQIEAGISSQEKERARFAKDLHDGFGQMISVLNINLQSLERNPESRNKVFEESSKVLEEMYQELKGICFNLMPQTLINNGLSSALREFASRINVSGKLVVETDFFGLEKRLTNVQEISLYRITQEWVNNILKYSDADRINIQITKDEEEITLMVEDNGMGFDPDLLQSGKGNGWRNMNSRANLIKGELELDTQVGMKGSTLIVNAPIAYIRQEKTHDIPV
jgi:signal transduction histidine kinase